MYARGHNTRGTGKSSVYLPGTSVSSVRPCHNTRNFCEFRNTSIPVPETSGSCARLPYPYPESTNPTEHHNLGNLHSTCVPQTPANTLLTNGVTTLVIWKKMPTIRSVFDLGYMGLVGSQIIGENITAQRTRTALRGQLHRGAHTNN